MPGILASEPGMATVNKCTTFCVGPRMLWSGQFCTGATEMVQDEWLHGPNLGCVALSRSDIALIMQQNVLIAEAPCTRKCTQVS